MSSESAELERQLQDSIPETEQSFRDRADELCFIHCEFDDRYPPNVARTAVLSGGGQTLRAIVRLNVSTDGTQPNRIVEAIEDWFNSFLAQWIAARTGADPQALALQLKGETQLSQWGSAPTWGVEIDRSFDLAAS